jgi:16S rRNA (uracil1498-N3)-methyltransferase
VLKGDKSDLVIQKAVELGVTAVVPISTVRTDVKLGASDKRADRWRRIALEATKQSGRARLMSVADPVSFRSVIERSQGAVLFSERDGESFETVTNQTAMTVIFGPEGGWDDAELELARSHDCRIITLGGRIMRAETAAISIAAILQHCFGDLN